MLELATVLEQDSRDSVVAVAHRIEKRCAAPSIGRVHIDVGPFKKGLHYWQLALRSGQMQAPETWIRVELSGGLPADGTYQRGPIKVCARAPIVIARVRIDVPVKEEAKTQAIATARQIT